MGGRASEKGGKNKATITYAKEGGGEMQGSQAKGKPFGVQTRRTKASMEDAKKKW